MPFRVLALWKRVGVRETVMAIRCFMIWGGESP
jgi:hypothetical protein